MSTLTVTSVQNIAGDGAAQLYEGTAKAWASIVGTGTAAVSESLNVTSLTDNGTGDYDLNLTSAMSGTTYHAASGSTFMHSAAFPTSASQVGIAGQNSSHSAVDLPDGSSAVDGDLA